MNRIFMLLASLGLMASPAKSPVPTYPAPMLSLEKLETAKRFTVLISVEGFAGSWRGTGVIIDSTHILTCAHVAQSPELWIYTYPLGRVRLAHPVYMSQSKDLAVLELDDPVILGQYATFSSSAAVGQPLVVVGNTLGAMHWFVSYGIVSDKEMIYLLTTALIKGGNSGGPWLDLDNHVIALTDWGLEKHGQDVGISGGINGETIIKFLKAWKSPNPFEIIFGSL